MENKAKIIVSSDFMLKKLRNIALVPDTFEVVKIFGSELSIGNHFSVSCDHRGCGEFQIKADSFIGLMRLLKTLYDQPITLKFGEETWIGIDGIIV